ncbi:MAG: barstar family protein [Xanthomonadaceae bacterium]|nr:barstar family protein [Xanthomonadaceae bacterium]MDE1963315.1 barstar family protein [Xanthomonadaceae bacterium]
MNRTADHLDLSRPLLSGVYDVDPADYGALGAQAHRHELALCRIDLAGCHDKHAVLARIAGTLRLPEDFGANWDALADCLRDPAWHPGWGHVLLFEHVDGLRRQAPADLAVLRGVLDDAATFALEHDRPFFAFLPLPTLAD